MEEAENRKLHSYLGSIKKALSDVSVVFESGCASDAKTSVYHLSERLNELNITDKHVYKEISRRTNDCWTAISSAGGVDPYERAGRAMEELGMLEKYVQGLISNETLPNTGALPFNQVLLWFYLGIDVATFIYLTFFDGYVYNAWNWMVAIPANVFLSTIWPIYWGVLHWIG